MPLSKFFSCLQFRMNDNINKLDYSNNIFGDCFPHVWQYERTLEELNITSTKVTYLPPQLFYCHSLKVFLASNNNIEIIPEAVGGLWMLQELNLNRNLITNVPDNIKCCKNLTFLDLSYNNLVKIPDAITCLISLQELLLNETYLEFLPANFGRLVNLRILELRSNSLAYLPKSMQRLSNLLRLDIGCNDFTALPEFVGELKQLREFWFDFNQIKDFPSNLGKLRNLMHCEGSGNCFSTIPKEMGDCHSLELLSVSTNNINKIFCDVGLLKSLVTLKCENNLLISLPDSISMLESLEELDVSHNTLESLPKTIGLLRKLRYLFADDNLRSIPDEICSCSALNILSISRNQVSKLPTNLGHLHNLKVLNIAKNNISSLPATILSLVNLKSLWISCNQSKPLIPLQYTDILKKSELTCFMLPQLNTEYQPQICASKQEFVSQSGNILTKRRICFAEQATILSSIKKQFIATNSALTTNNDSSYVAQNSCNLITEHCTKLKPAPSKDLLTRSPTPYTKELRLMAQFIQMNQTKHNLGHKHSEDKKSINFNRESIQIKGETSYNFTYNNELFPEKSNNQYITIFDREGDVQAVSELIRNISGYQLDVSNNSTTNITGKEMTEGPDIYNTAKCKYKKKLGGISNEDFAMKLSFKKCKIVCAETQCLNPNAFSRNSILKSNNKWLFGAHKNPKVLQVQVVWENGCDITVNFLPKKEGIYILSIVPETKASEALLPFDKLLEVDGIDFTCISLDGARLVLDRPRPIINIMLSR